jgi:hypothetical protein
VGRRGRRGSSPTVPYATGAGHPPTPAPTGRPIEVLAPFLADLDRRAGIGVRDAAVEIGCGVLLGLHSCRNCRDDDLLLTHAGLPDAVDALASQVLSAMAEAGLAIPDDWLDEQCPDWVGLSGR